jgi:hypothetical protein
MYVTLARAKMHLDITINDFDAKIESCIKSASLKVKNYIKRNIEFRRVEYSVTGNNTQLLKVITFPLKKIYSVVLNGNDITSECSIDTDSSLFIYREKGFNIIGINDIFNLSEYQRRYPKKNITLDIEGGYKLPSEFDSDFPEDIQAIVLKLVKLMFTNSSIQAEIATESFSGKNFTMSKGYRQVVAPIEFSEDDKETLNFYKEMV